MEKLRAVVDEAHRRGLPVVAHSHRPEEIRRGPGGRRRLLRAHRALERARVSRGRHRGDPGADREHEPRPAVLDADDRRAAQLRVPARQPRALDDTSWHEGLTPEIIADIRKSIAHPDRLPYFQLTPARRPTLARKFKQLREAGVVMLVGTDSGIPMKFHSQSTWQRARRLGQHPRRRLDDRDPRRHLLAVGGDEGGPRGRHGRRRASTPTSSRCGATCSGISRCCSASTW